MKTILLIGAMAGMLGFASQAHAGVRISVGVGGGFYGGPYYGPPPYYYGYNGPAVYYYGPGYYPWYHGYYRGGYYRGGYYNHSSAYSHH